MTRTLSVAFDGAFSLQAAAEFGFGPNAPGAFDGVMRLAFALDGGGYAGVLARQPRVGGPLECEVEGDGDLGALERQLRRVLSLDQDGEGFAEIGRRDAVIGELQRHHPGQRPVLFQSPYEAAAWAIISARRPAASAAKLRRLLAERLGASFELGGQTTLEQYQAISEAWRPYRTWAGVLVRFAGDREFGRSR